MIGEHKPSMPLQWLVGWPQFDADWSVVARVSGVLLSCLQPATLHQVFMYKDVVQPATLHCCRCTAAVAAIAAACRRAGLMVTPGSSSSSSGSRGASSSSTSSSSAAATCGLRKALVVGGL